MDKRQLELQSGQTIHVSVAHSFWQRARGLLFSPQLQMDECLVIASCKSVHTIGMRYSLDIVFIDCLGFVTDIYVGIKPYRLVFGSRHALTTVEFTSGSSLLEQVHVGTRLFK